MRFIPTELEGALIIEPERLVDERGFFARTWCSAEFARCGISTDFVQCNISFNHRKGTLRGLHFQDESIPEAKLIRCTMGAVFDVMVDLRTGSPTFGKWKSIELSALNRRMAYIPAGFAHGFQTLCDDTELFYQMSEFYRPELAFGICWNDPMIAIRWPECNERIISPRDLTLPRLEAWTHAS